MHQRQHQQPEEGDIPRSSSGISLSTLSCASDTITRLVTGGGVGQRREPSPRTKKIGSLVAALTTCMIFAAGIRSCIPGEVTGWHRQQNHPKLVGQHRPLEGDGRLPLQQHRVASASSSVSRDELDNYYVPSSSYHEHDSINQDDAAPAIINSKNITVIFEEVDAPPPPVAPEAAAPVVALASARRLEKKHHHVSQQERRQRQENVKRERRQRQRAMWEQRQQTMIRERYLRVTNFEETNVLASSN